MDIASVSMALSQSSALTKIGTAMLSKAMDTDQALGQGLVEMIDAAAMERSVNPHVGSNFDMLV
ncbi:MAG: YjfB family protein [Lachnospiraceae bacterium]|nr:YjfB family protein [Lachnospiraceae bacterium]